MSVQVPRSADLRVWTGGKIKLTIPGVKLLYARWKVLIVGKFGQSKCVARPVAKEIDKMKCEEEPLLLLGVALFIVKYMPANTKPVGRSTWRRLDK